MTTAPSRKTDYVVVGENAGPKKLETIKEYKIKTFSEEEFYKFVSEMPAKPPKTLEKIIEHMPSHAKQIEAKNKLGAQIIPSPISSPVSVVENTKPFVNRLMTDLYAPKTINDIIGNQSAISQVLNWLKQWNPAEKASKSTFKAVLLSGPPGIGKSTTASLVAKTLGLLPIELNASDCRSKKSLEEQVKVMTTNSSCDRFYNPKFVSNPHNRVDHVLIMDEVDGMSSGDRGGVAELIQLIKKTKIPIICICNDRSSPKIRSLANHCLDVRFRRLDARQLLPRFAQIAQAESISIKPNALEQLINSCHSDLRQILNVLSVVKLNNKQDFNFDDAKFMYFAFFVL